MKASVVRYARFTLVAVLFLLNIATFSPATRLQAQETKSGNEFDYYSDDTFTCQIGFIIYCNDGETIRSGDTSPYVIISPAGC